MTTHVLALDQGTTSSRSILFDARGDVVAVAQREFTQHFPRSGLGRARRGGDLVDAGRDDRRGARARAPDRRGRRRDRHHQSARDHRPVGSSDRPASRTRPRLAGSPHRRRLCACSRPPGTRRRSRVARASCSIPISRRPSLRGCSTATRRLRAARGAGRARLRHDRQLARLESHRRRRARQRRHEREPHAAAQHRNRQLGPVAARAVPRAARRAATCGGVLPAARRIVRANRGIARFRSAASPAISRRRSSARRASSRGWPRTPTAPAASC